MSRLSSKTFALISQLLDMQVGHWLSELSAELQERLDEDLQLHHRKARLLVVHAACHIVRMTCAFLIFANLAYVVVGSSFLSGTYGEFFPLGVPHQKADSCSCAGWESIKYQLEAVPVQVLCDKIWQRESSF